MKNTLLRLSALAAILSLSVTSVAYAAMPTLSVYTSGTGDIVQINVTGDPNAAVWLYKNNYGGQQQYLGTTNQSGYLTTSLSSATTGLAPGNYVYVLVNGQPSSQVAWPSVYGGGYYGGTISFCP